MEGGPPEPWGDRPRRRGDGGRHGDSRGGRGRGGGGARAWREAASGAADGGYHRGPTTVGVAPDPCLQDAPQATGMGSQCIVCCADNPSYVGIGRCRHSDVCWVCTLRLRALSKDQKCPMCKEVLEEVLLTNDASESLSEYQLQELACEPSVGVRFRDDRIRREALRLLGYRCALDKCESRSDSYFQTLAELQDHLWYVHWMQFCKTCLQGRAAFPCEQVVYTESSLERHCKDGDRGQLKAKRPTPPVPPHPLCEFCKERMYNEDALIRHMHRKHQLCILCERAGRRNEFYSNWKCLSLHYQDKHHVCAHKDCVRGGHRLIAFADEEELHIHYMVEHNDSSRLTAQGKIRLTAGQMSYADEHNIRTRGKGQGKGRNVARDAADFSVNFMWPPGASREDCMDGTEDLGRDSDSDDERFPMRELVADEPHTHSKPETAQEEEDEVKEIKEVEPEPLMPGLEALDLKCSVAMDGPRLGSRSCLNALAAVLEVLVPGPAAPDSALVAAIGRLSLSEVESLERMRHHLDDTHKGKASCDWEPLERVLGLRPLFFLLLQAGTPPEKEEKATGPYQRTAIGPRQGPEAVHAADAAKAWRSWKVAAQAAIQTLGIQEQQRVRRYVMLCLRQRAVLATFNSPALGPAPASAEDFPTLGSSSGAVPNVAANERAAPFAGGGGGSEAAKKPAWSERVQGRSMQDEFPTLGAASAPSPAAGNSSWSRAKVQGPPPVVIPVSTPPAEGSWARPKPAAIVAAVAKPAAKVAAAAPAAVAVTAQPPPKPELEAFPSLAGCAPSVEFVTWGMPTERGTVARAKEEERITLEDWATKSKEVQAVEFKGTSAEAFPDLPCAPRPQGPAASWAKAAKAKPMPKSVAKAAARAEAMAKASQEAIAAAEASAQARKGGSSSSTSGPERLQVAPLAVAAEGHVEDFFPEIFGGKLAAKPKASASGQVASPAKGLSKEPALVGDDQLVMIAPKGKDDDIRAPPEASKKKKGREKVVLDVFR